VIAAVHSFSVPELNRRHTLIAPFIPLHLSIGPGAWDSTAVFKLQRLGHLQPNPKAITLIAGSAAF
jgi:hypothetical protein